MLFTNACIIILDNYVTLNEFRSNRVFVIFGENAYLSMCVLLHTCECGPFD